jgi:cytoskeletal protein RodZ
VSDKSAAVLPITPLSSLGSRKAGSNTPGITPAEFGERLLRGREQKNRSLGEVADTTKIAIHQLRSLERGDLHRLPGGIYRRAIVRQYAAAVGLNVEDTLRDLASIGGEADGRDQTVEPVVVPPGDAASSSFSMALWRSAAAFVVLGAIAALATAWYRGEVTARASDVPLTAASATTPATDAPAIALVAATEGVRANTGNVEHATDPSVLPNEPEPETVAEVHATEGELRITSEPAGALITVNGIGWGMTPVTIPYMPFGKKVIRATKPGYLSAQRGIDFVPDRRGRSVRIQLSPESPETR